MPISNKIPRHTCDGKGSKEGSHSEGECYYYYWDAPDKLWNYQVIAICTQCGLIQKVGEFKISTIEGGNQK